MYISRAKFEESICQTRTAFPPQIVSQTFTSCLSNPHDGQSGQ